MKRSLLTLTFVVTSLAAANAETVAPGDVVFAEDGSVAQSLTGVPGDPAAGAKVYSSKSIGNCVACHANDAMPDVAFPGNIGPNLGGAGERWSEAQLRGIVTDAKHTFTADSVMPSFYKTEGFIRLGDKFTGKAWPAEKPVEPILTAQQIEDAVAYLMTLK
jgi:sulfur-oxidizing protein SoxX